VSLLDFLYSFEPLRALAESLDISIACLQWRKMSSMPSASPDDTLVAAR
jgi:hypothetical protein